MFAGAEDSERLTPPEMARASAKHCLQFAFTYPEYYTLIFNTLALNPSRTVADIAQDPGSAGLQELIQSGIDDGHLRLPKGHTPVLMAF